MTLCLSLPVSGVYGVCSLELNKWLDWALLKFNAVPLSSLKCCLDCINKISKRRENNLNIWQNFITIFKSWKGVAQVSPFGYETSYFIFIGAIIHDVAGLYGVFTFFSFLTRHFMMYFLLFYFLQLSSSLPKNQNILVITSKPV